MLRLGFHPADWGASQRDGSLPSLSGPGWAVEWSIFGEESSLSTALSAVQGLYLLSPPWEGMGGPNISISSLLDSSALPESMLFPGAATGKKSANTGTDFPL